KLEEFDLVPHGGAVLVTKPPAALPALATTACTARPSVRGCDGPHQHQSRLHCAETRLCDHELLLIGCEVGVRLDALDVLVELRGHKQHRRTSFCPGVDL